MAESLRTRLQRWGFNLFPAYRGTGARITYIDASWQEVHVRLPLNWRTRNYVGTIFGGSMYGAVDPVYMIMLIKVLGPSFVVWDKAAAIRFRLPGRRTLHARFVLSGEEIERVRSLLRERDAVDRTYRVELTSRDGAVHAYVDKTVHIRRREARPAEREERGDRVAG